MKLQIIEKFFLGFLKIMTSLSYFCIFFKKNFDRNDGNKSR